MGFLFGICEWNLPVSGLSAIRMAADAGFDGIQIHELGGIAANFPLNDPYVQQSYREAARSGSIALQTLHLRALALEGQMLYHQGTAQYDQAVLSIDKGISACTELGVPVLFLSSFFKTYLYNDYEISNFAYLLRYACKAAESQGIEVVYETALPYPRLSAMLENIDYPVGILYDTFNPFLFGFGDPVSEIELLVDKIKQLHVKDRLPDFKQFCLLGDGAGQIERTAALLKEKGWSGWVVSETSHYLIENIERTERTQKTDRNSFLDLQKTDLKRMKALFNW